MPVLFNSILGAASAEPEPVTINMSVTYCAYMAYQASHNPSAWPETRATSNFVINVNNNVATISPGSASGPIYVGSNAINKTQVRIESIVVNLITRTRNDDYKYYVNIDNELKEVDYDGYLDYMNNIPTVERTT